MKIVLNILTSIAFMSGAALAAAAPIHGPDAQEVSAAKAAPELGGDFPQSCMVITENMYLCSATVISKNQAITAAHCAEGKASAKVTLYCGGSRVKYTGVLTPNPQYNLAAGLSAANIKQDYGFVKLSNRTLFSAVAMPYAASARWGIFSNPAMSNCMIAGWGDNNGGTNQRLFYAPITELGMEDSVIVFGHKGGNRNGIDLGDSGGTLMCKYEQTWYLVGVLSAKGKNNLGAAVNVMDWRN